MHEIIGQLCEQALKLGENAVVVVVTGDSEQPNVLTNHGPYWPQALLNALNLEDKFPEDDISIPQWTGTDHGDTIWMEMCAGGFIVFTDMPVGPGEQFTMKG